MALNNLPTPDSANLNNHYILGEIIAHVQELADGFPHIDYQELIDQITQVRNRNVDPEVQVRGFLKVFESTPFFKDEASKLDPTTRAHLKDFIKGSSAAQVVEHRHWTIRPSPGAKHHFSLLQFFERFSLHDMPVKYLEANGLPVIYEDAAKTMVMEVYSEVPFENWGLSVSNIPRYTFVPTKALGLQNLVLYAREQNLRVRCAGYRHSWSHSFSANGEILVSLLNLKQVTEVPDATELGPSMANVAGNELKSIELVSEHPSRDRSKQLVRVGVSVTSEEFRRWAVVNNAWTLPMDVILVEVTFGGVNAPICHGAGRRHQTLSDQVREIEYIDANGKQQSVSDPELLTAAAGCFGLLGIVTHITFELEAMTYAVMKPRKPDVNLAVPALSQSDVPAALKKNFDDAQIADALAKFEDHAISDYYSEWFWFPYQQTAWVNCWNNTSDTTHVVDYPTTGEIWLQWIEGWIGGVMTASPFFAALPPHWQAQLLATAGMAVLPPTLFEEPEPEITTYLPNALHFRRGTQNARVRDMEFQIPLPPLPHDHTKPDLTFVRKAWWDVINLVYAAEHNKSPLRLTLELRIMGASNIIMAPQYGNDLGTACIEVLTCPDTVEDGEWADFCQKVYDKWAQYGWKKPGREEEVPVRPHWAKEWDGLQMHGMDARQYLKTVAYKERIVDFKERLTKIGGKQGWGLEDLQKRFSNELWDEIVFS